MNRTTIAFLVILLIGACSVGHAEQDLTQLSLEELMNIPVVSVSKTKQPLLDHPVTAAVVTRERIMERGYRDLLDVLRDLPGIHVVEFGNSEHTGTEVFIRGMDVHTKVIFLMDGQEIGPPTGEPLTFLRNLPLVNVKQVEVSYGAAASLYGADAIAGIINIVTLSGSDMGEKRTAVWLGAGSYETYDTQLRHAVDIGDNAALSLSGGFYSSSQENLPKSYPEVFGNYNVDALVESYNLNAKLDVRDFSLSYLRMAGKRNNALGFNPALYDYSGESVWDICNEFWRLKWDREWSSTWETHTSVSYSTNELDSNSTYSTDWTASNNYIPHYFFWKGESTRLAHDIHMDRGQLSWLSGVAVEWFESIPKTDIDNPIGSYNLEYTNAGAFTQMEVQAHKQLTLTAGIRYDRDSRFEGEWNPRIGALYHPVRSLRTHISWGTAYLAPSPHKVYERWGQIAEGEYVHLPNPDLKPEQTSTIDAGVDWFPTDNSYLAVSGFYTNADDLWRIAYVGPIEIDGVNVEYQTNDNTAKSLIYGFHLSGEYELQRRIILDGHYSYTGGEEDAVDLEGKVFLTHMPRHLLRVSTTWRLENGSVRLTGRWFDRIVSHEHNALLMGDRIGGVWTFDLFAQHRILSCPNLAVGLEVRNLLDESYVKISKYDDPFFALPTIPQPKRTIGISVIASF